MKLHGSVSFDCELVIVDWDCLLVDRGVQVVPRVLQRFLVQSTESVRKNRMHLSKIDWGNLAFF